MTPNQAAEQLLKAIEDSATSNYPLGDSVPLFLAEWCAGAGSAGESRAAIFATDEGTALLGNLCALIRGDAGNFLESAIKLRLAINAGAAEEVTDVDLAALEVVLSTSGTRLCSDPPTT